MGAACILEKNRGKGGIMHIFIEVGGKKVGGRTIKL